MLESTLDRQMWCWGRDIRRPEGNLLVTLGCRRCPSEPTGRSEYACACGAGVVRLWGFGVMLVPDGGDALALRRNDPEPLLIDARTGRAGHFDRDGLAGACRRAGPSDRDLLARLLPPLARWIAGYEAQVHAHCGERWRRRVQASWARGDGSVIDMPRRWRRMAGAVERALAA